MPNTMRYSIEGLVNLLLMTDTFSSIVIANEGRPEDELHLARWITAAARGIGIDIRQINAADQDITASHLEGNREDLLLIHNFKGCLDETIRAIHEVVQGAACRRDVRRVVLVSSGTTLPGPVVDRSLYISLEMERRITPPLIHLMREASGLSMMDCTDAAELAISEYEADFVLALCIRNAASYAVMIRSKDPKVSDAKARGRWNVSHALGYRDDVVRRSSAWRRLDELSGRYQPK